MCPERSRRPSRRFRPARNDAPAPSFVPATIRHPRRPARRHVTTSLLLAVAAGCGGVTDPVPAGPAPLLLLATAQNNITSAELYLASEDGRAVRQITSLGPDLKTSVRWSPDGRSVAFVRQPASGVVTTPNVGDVWVAPLDGGAVRQVTATGDVVAVRWLGSDRLAVYRQGYGLDRWNVIPAAGGTPALLSLSAEASGTTTTEWNDDGSRLAYRRTVIGQPAVVVAAAGAGEAPRDLAAASLFRWVPGTNQLAVLLANPDGGGQVIATVAAGGGSPDVVFGDTLVSAVSAITVAGDGRRAAFVRSGRGIQRAYVALSGQSPRLAYTGVAAGGSWYELEVAWRPTTP